MSRTEMTIPVDSILKLPEEATYNKRSGQSSAEVRRSGDTIIVTATCDSLGREVEYYESLYSQTYDELARLQQEIQTEREQRSNPVKIALAAFIAGLFVGVISTIIIIAKRYRL